MGRFARWVVVVATTVGVAFTTFWLLVRLLRPGYASHEYVTIVVWSAPLGFFVLVATRPVRTRLQGRPIVRALAGVFAALSASVIWTFVAIGLTGGYALAFDANPLWCWTLASLAGTAVNLWWQLPRGESDSSGKAAI